MTAADQTGAYLVSVPELGRRLGISRSRAYELVAAGAVRTVAIGARRLVPVIEADRYVAGLLTAAGIEAGDPDAP